VLYTSLSQTLGEHPAAVMMELLPPVGWGDVARHGDLVAVRGEMAELRGEMAELRAELKGDIIELRREMRALLPKLITPTSPPWWESLVCYWPPAPCSDATRYPGAAVVRR